MTLLRLLRQARKLYPLLSWYDLLIAGLEELIDQNARTRDKETRDIYERWAELSLLKWKEWAELMSRVA